MDCFFHKKEQLDDILLLHCDFLSAQIIIIIIFLLLHEIPPACFTFMFDDMLHICFSHKLTDKPHRM